MQTIKVSQKFQIVIPKDVRENLAIKLSEKIQVFQFGHKIELLPIKDIKSMRGFFKGYRH
jgi:AbrB family looped-hinge helix DNA binding protein